MSSPPCLPARSPARLPPRRHVAPPPPPTPPRPGPPFAAAPRFRHLLLDLIQLLPHSKKDAKLDTKSDRGLINEVADLKGCSSALFFEARKHKDLYIWMAKTPSGPSVKFHVTNSECAEGARRCRCCRGERARSRAWARRLRASLAPRPVSLTPDPPPVSNPTCVQSTPWRS